MRSSKARPAAALAAVALVGLTGCGGAEKKPEEDEPRAGIISDRFSRAIPLDTPRAQFLEQAGVEPVRTTTERSKASKEPVKKLDPSIRRRLERRFGKARNGFIHIPAREFECLNYRGEQPENYSRKFCFGEEGRLEYLSTAPPLPEDRSNDDGPR